MPRDQPYKDVVTLINYILRQFFKAIEKDTFLAVEASILISIQFIIANIQHPIVGSVSKESWTMEELLQLGIGDQG